MRTGINVGDLFFWPFSFWVHLLHSMRLVSYLVTSVVSYEVILTRAVCKSLEYCPLILPLIALIVFIVLIALV
ncbi:hypothetical protein GGR50DRAFT_664596 [Xylaria sp. CBS 124048]|nr:hypothetical protein GGR50DRAFT_664596 [Xylaria sp. CBS 124048]